MKPPNKLKKRATLRTLVEYYQEKESFQQYEHYILRPIAFVLVAVIVSYVNQDADFDEWLPTIYQVGMQVQEAESIEPILILLLVQIAAALGGEAVLSILESLFKKVLHVFWSELDSDILAYKPFEKKCQSVVLSRATQQLKNYNAYTQALGTGLSLATIGLTFTDNFLSRVCMGLGLGQIVVDGIKFGARNAVLDAEKELLIYFKSIFKNHFVIKTSKYKVVSNYFYSYRWALSSLDLLCLVTENTNHSIVMINKFLLEAGARIMKVGDSTYILKITDILKAHRSSEKLREKTASSVQEILMSDKILFEKNKRKQMASKNLKLKRSKRSRNRSKSKVVAQESITSHFKKKSFPNIFLEKKSYLPEKKRLLSNEQSKFINNIIRNAKNKKGWVIYGSYLAHSVNNSTPFEDIDIAYPCYPDELCKIAKKNKLKRILVSSGRLLFTGTHDGQEYDFTSYHGETIEGFIKKADFICNMAYLDIRENKIYYIHEQALSHMKRQFIAINGDIKTRIDDSPVIIFRALAKYAKGFTLEPKLREYLLSQDVKDILKKENPSRKANGLLKIFSIGNISDSVRCLNEFGLTHCLLPDAHNTLANLKYLSNDASPELIVAMLYWPKLLELVSKAIDYKPDLKKLTEHVFKSIRKFICYPYSSRHEKYSCSLQDKIRYIWLKTLVKKLPTYEADINSFLNKKIDRLHHAGLDIFVEQFSDASRKIKPGAAYANQLEKLFKHNKSVCSREGGYDSSSTLTL